MDDSEIKLKQTKIIFNALTTNSNSIFYSTGRITKNLLSKARKSFYAKDKVLAKLYNELEDKNKLYIDE